MHRFLYKLFISLGILLYFPCYSANASVSDIGGQATLSSFNNSNPYIVRFTSQGANAPLTVNVNNATIKSIDLNGATQASLVVNPGVNLLLGSIYNQSPGSSSSNAKMDITIGSGSTLTLTGDNYWAEQRGNNPPAPTSNSFYYDYNSSDFLITNALGQPITAVEQNIIGEYLFAQLYAGAIPQSFTQTYIGPYNIYNGTNSTILGDNSNFVIDTTLSTSGNGNAFDPGGSMNNSPTILTNSFVFLSPSSATLTIKTPLIATHSSIGGFGHIASDSNNILAPALVINAADPTIINSTWDDTSNLQLFLLSSTTITNPTFVTRQTYIGNDAAAYPSSPALTIKPSDSWTTSYHSLNSNFAQNGLYVSYIYPLGDSKLTLDSSGATGGVHFFSFVSGIGGWDFLDAGGSPFDLAGNVELIAGNNNPLTIDSGNNPNPGNNFEYGSMGMYDANINLKLNRLKSLTLTGTKQIDVIMPVYSQRIAFNSSAPINIVQPSWVTQNIDIPPSTMGDGAVITLMQDVVPGSSITLGNWHPALQSGNNPVSMTIDLDKYKFNIGESIVQIDDNTSQTFNSMLNFVGDITINTSFEANSQFTGGRGGKFVIGNGSTLDLSNTNLNGYNGSTTLTVNFTHDGTVPANGEYSYILFGALGNGSIILPSADHINFQDNSSPHPLIPMTWQYNPNTYVISSTTDRSQAVGIVQGGGGSRGAVAIINNLTTPAGGSSFINELQASAINKLNADTLGETINNLEQLVLSSEVEDAVTYVVSAHESEYAAQLADSDSLMFTEGETAVSGEGVAAGHDSNIKKQQGAWVSGFFQKANQKTENSIPGYKITGNGGTLGFDTGITDNLILGLAWSMADSNLKRTELKGSGSKVKTNVLSLYSLMRLPKNWLIQSSISGGFSQIKSRSLRNTAIASSNHKSNYLGANIHLLKRITLNSNFTAESNVGLNMNEFKEKAYKEQGDGTNWHVGKRRSYNIEGIIGGKLLSSYKLNDGYLLKPYISAYSHITIKDRRGKIHMSLDSKIPEITLDPPKASAIWYSGGAGLIVYKGALELSAAWELRRDKGYTSNQGTVKFRVEF